MKLNDKQTMYVKSMGKLLKVTAIFTTDDEANKYMEAHKDEGCIACFGDYILIANYYDHGVIIKDQKKCHICNDTGWNTSAQCAPSKKHPTGWKTIKCDCMDKIK